MPKKGSKQKDQVPQTPNDVEETPEVVSDSVEARVNPIYQKFLDQLSSSERDVILAEPVKGIPSFRKFLENSSDQELLEMVK